MSYAGRFAPSPTGPLHFGSLVAALASYLDARHYDGKWLLRIEDLDPPRESAEAPREIMQQLTAFGLNWDDDVLYQGNRDEAYENALSKLAERNLIYPCTCTRKMTPPVYPGTCRGRSFNVISEPHSTRLRIASDSIEFCDRVFGLQRWETNDEIGDFIIRRKDGLWAYQLAVVVDDDFQGINQVVRGSDLLDSTPRQIALYQALDLPQPSYLHISVLLGPDGHKLSKQAHASPVKTDNPVGTLRAALKELGQDPQADCDEKGLLLERAARAWDVDNIPREMQVNAPADYL